MYVCVRACLRVHVYVHAEFATSAQRSQREKRAAFVCCSYCEWRKVRKLQINALRVKKTERAANAHPGKRLFLWRKKQTKRQKRQQRVWLGGWNRSRLRLKFLYQVCLEERQRTMVKVKTQRQSLYRFNRCEPWCVGDGVQWQLRHTTYF